MVEKSPNELVPLGYILVGNDFVIRHDDISDSNDVVLVTRGDRTVAVFTDAMPEPKIASNLANMILESEESMSRGEVIFLDLPE